MSHPPILIDPKNLVQHSLQHTDSIHYQTSPEELEAQTVQLQQGQLAASGALVIRTGAFTGRSPKDKYLVRDQITANMVDWNGFNHPLEEAYFTVIHKKIMEHFSRVPELWVRDCYACADERYRMPIRVITDKPWMSLFAYNMLLRPDAMELPFARPEWQVLIAPDLQLDPATCGTRSANASVISFTHKTILVAGTGYTGELKKGVFTVLNFLMPGQNVLPMHCAANKGQQGDTAIFFGLSGTGKTTLSTDPARHLIGDDEHGWSQEGIFNFEGGCYAKTIGLNEEKEPEIFRAIRKGALLENVVLLPGTNEVDFNDASITENARVSYPLDFIPGAATPAAGGPPQHIFFLTCDAFGVLPPLSRLTAEQAMYHFISGYTAKVAGTETDVTEPTPTFSACFGAPFLPLHPGRYASLLGEKLRQQQVPVWLVNTGWSGGGPGAGSRISLKHTRALINAALEGQLDNATMHQEPFFGLAVPAACPGVPDALLQPRDTWQDPEAYDAAARHLAQLFRTNFEKYAAGVSPEVQEAGPIA